MSNELEQGRDSARTVRDRVDARGCDSVTKVNQTRQEVRTQDVLCARMLPKYRACVVVSSQSLIKSYCGYLTSGLKGLWLVGSQSNTPSAKDAHYFFIIALLL